jgi:two-component system sensor kinase FixL
MRGFVEKRDPERRPVSMAPLIRECLDLVMLGDAHSGVKISAEIPDDLPEISADPVQIQQVLVNLARNALEAVRECKRRVVRVRAFTEGPDMIVSVSDSGGGVPPEVVPNLFRAFSGIKRRGLGLGLTISRSIAQNHGGDLSVEPLGEDGGAVFVLRLPLDASAEETSVPADSQTKGPSE